ncbi:MAG: RecX family transcriptional regulator [Deltaproteobacteria bacterium]|nr:RecX family transcriptional regulator [Deltaproteobacteria bacterium]
MLETQKTTRQRPRGPKKASAQYLERAALFHLQRHSCSSAGLRQVLMRRVSRSARAHGTDPAEGRAIIDELVIRFERAGLLDDRRFAQAKAESLKRSGTSMRAISARLKARGVATEQVEQALQALHDEGEGDHELEAAHALARRRRLGPYRPEGQRAERREKDLAVLLRAGFAYSVAKQIMALPGHPGRAGTNEGPRASPASPGS